MPKFDIIIPHWGKNRNLTNLATNCVRSIRDHSSDYRIIFVDNGTPPEEFALIEPELRGSMVVRNTQNMGFVRATNQGLALSSAPYVVLMNNDTQAVPNWLELLAAPLELPVGLSGPLTDTQGSWQGRWQGRGRAIILEKHRMLAFFCVMIRREVIDACGYLDEGFGLGFGDDDHYCWLAHQKGFRMALQQDLLIPHHHRSTFKSMFTDVEIKERQRTALDRFYSITGGKP